MQDSVSRTSWIPLAAESTGSRFSHTPQGASLNVTALRFIMRFLYRNTTHAVISVCRYNETVQTKCGGGLDTDCDGLVDAKDPDCMGRIPPSPPSSCLIDGYCDPRT
jgi:hypothetical protein